MAVTFRDNSAQVLRQLNANVSATLEALGIASVGLIVKQMQRGYGRPIWQTGDLQRDVNYDTNESAKSVTVGNSLEYGPYVHEGTSRMPGRPYIRDALLSPAGTQRLQDVAQAYMSQGFE